MLRSIIKIYILIAVLTSQLTWAKKDDEAKKKAQKMETFMRDLYSANSLNDLKKYGAQDGKHSFCDR